MKFDIKKKVPFEIEGWEDCYLEFSLPSYGDLKNLTESLITKEETDLKEKIATATSEEERNKLQVELDAYTERTNNEKIEKGIAKIVELFVDGYAMSNGERVQVKKEDLKDLPITILTDCFKAISGEVSPK